MTRDEFTSLALSHMEEIAAFARRLSGHAADADDLLQATYEHAFRSAHKLREARALRVWLFRIARNLYLDRVRTTAARTELRLVESADAVAAEPFLPAESVERMEAHELEAALSVLSDEQREAVLLCDLWGFEYVEVAEISGTPVGTVKSRVSRARTRLAELLTDAMRRNKKGGFR